MIESTHEYKELLDRGIGSHLMLCNEQGETHCVGKAQTVKQVSQKLKMVWPVTFESHAYPFTIAVLHEGEDIILVKEITPIVLDPRAGTLEINF